jgi:hypothetical protein
MVRQFIDDLITAPNTFYNLKNALHCEKMKSYFTLL